MWFLVLMFLHRDSFKRALTDNRMDPLISTHSYSFTTTYECACVILDSINLYANAKSLISRVWRIWTHLFCATVGNALRQCRVAAHHNFWKLFPGRNRSRGHTYPERKPRTVSPSETRGCMYFIRKNSQSLHLCIKCSRTYSHAYDS